MMANETQPIHVTPPAASSPPSAVATDDDATGLRYAVGAAWAIGGISIWASWMVVTRLDLLTSGLNLYDIVAIRFATAAAILLPFALRHGLVARSVGWSGTLVMASGSGLIYVLMGSAGLLFAPAAHAGPLIPGTMPLFAAILSVLILNEVIDRSRRIGLALIPIGAVAILTGSFRAFDTGEWRGDLLFLCAAFLWASYTVTLRRARLGPFHAAAIVAVWSAIAFLPVYILFLPKQMFDASWGAIAQQAVFQGLLVSVVSLVCFNRAVAILGASRAAVFASLVPAMAASLAVPVLGEVPGPFEIAGLLAVTVGVLFASGAVKVSARKNG